MPADYFNKMHVYKPLLLKHMNINTMPLCLF